MLNDFFEFSFVLLPNKKYEEDRFDTEVAKLQDRFTNPARVDYYFSDSYSKDLSSEHFPQYAAGLWQNIHNSEDLTRLGYGVRGWMANYRCAEVHDMILKDASKLVDSWRRLIDRDIVLENFGEKAEEAVRSAMERYHADAGANRAYPIYEQKAQDLRKRLDLTLRSLFLSQLQVLHSHALSEFQTGCQDLPARFFSDSAEELLKRSLDDFQAKALSSSRYDDWHPTVELDNLELDLRHLLGGVRAQALKSLYLKAQNKLIHLLDSPLERWSCVRLAEQLEQPSIALWPNLQRLVSMVVPFVQDNIRIRLCGQTAVQSSLIDGESFGGMCGFRASSEEVQNFCDAIQDFAVDHITSQIRKSAAAQLHNGMRNRFEASFLRTTSAAERQWLPGIDVSSFYNDAVDESLLLLDLLSVNRLEDRHTMASLFSNANRAKCDFRQPSTLENDYIILQPKECEEHRAFFLTHVADPLLQVAQRMQNASVASAVAAAEAVRAKEAPPSPTEGSASELAELGNVLLAQANQCNGTDRLSLLVHAAANFERSSGLSESAKTYSSWGVALYKQAKISVDLGFGHGGIDAALPLCKSSEDKYRKAIELDPALSEVTYNLGTVLFELAGLTNDDDDAAELYSKAVEQFERAQDDDTYFLDATVNCGVSLVKLATTGQETDPDQTAKLYQLAFEKFKKAIAIDPMRDDALLNWGVALADHAGNLPDAKAGDMYMTACEKFSAALDVNCKCYDALFNWGNTLTHHAARLPAGEAALAVLENAGDKFSLFAQANPGHTGALSNWALSLYRAGTMRVQITPAQDAVMQAEEAFKTSEAKLRQVLCIKPELEDAIVKLGLVLTARGQLRAQVHEANTLFLAAAECYRRASYLNPRHASIFVNWGLLLHMRAVTSSPDTAQLLYRAACHKHREAVDLGASDALVNWGHTLLACSKIPGTGTEQCQQFISEAQQRYRDAVAADPHDFIAVKCLGDSFFMMGELEGSEQGADFFDSAAKQYDMALKMCPSLEIVRINLLPAEHAKQLVEISTVTSSAGDVMSMSQSQSASS